jgi:hypothetical protein
MKKLIFIIALVSLTSFANAQDTIILKNGNKISAHVIEVGVSEIKYYKTDNPNSPTYIETKENVFVIKYQNGTKDVFNENLHKTDSVIIHNSEKGTSFQNDILILPNGDTTFAKIKEVDDGNIYFKQVKGDDTISLWSYSRSYLNKAFYKDGRQIAVTGVKGNQKNNTNQNKPHIGEGGREDAQRYYHNFGGAVAGTVLTSLFVSSIIGLIPAIACSSTYPNEHNLGLANNDKSKDQIYYSAYLREAKKIKSRKVWTGWGISVGVNLLCVLIWRLK